MCVYICNVYIYNMYKYVEMLTIYLNMVLGLAS